MYYIISAGACEAGEFKIDKCVALGRFEPERLNLKRPRTRASIIHMDCYLHCNPSLKMPIVAMVPKIPFVTPSLKMPIVAMVPKIAFVAPSLKMPIAAMVLKTAFVAPSLKMPIAAIVPKTATGCSFMGMVLLVCVQEQHIKQQEHNDNYQLLEPYWYGGA